LYARRGCQILDRKYALFGRKKLGELDIVCLDGKTLVIIEVKTRSSEKFLSLEETVDWRKQSFLRRMAKLYVQNKPGYEDMPIRIDVAAVLMDPVDNRVESVKIIENAIEDSL
jgi:putative endonuclease